MSFAGKLLQFYFNFAYNPAYDFTIAQLNHYKELQRRCIGKLQLTDGDKVLCVGIGTGNEIHHILQANGNIHIVGIDLSENALEKARKKALMLGKKIEVRKMDAQRLDFETEYFDKVVCMHVMDFVNDTEEVTNEIFRILKENGKFVITYPSGKEDATFGLNLLKDNIRHHVNSGKNYAMIIFDLLARALVGILCLPMLFRPGRRVYSEHELEGIFAASKVADLFIEEDALYRDFIICGRKQK